MSSTDHKAPRYVAFSNSSPVTSSSLRSK